MYSNFTINHEGKSFLPNGIVKPKQSELLDCGHPRPEVKPNAFTMPWGYVTTANGQEEYCIACCDALELEAIKTLPVYQAYYDYKDKTINTWNGTVLMKIVDCNIYYHNFGGRFISILARDLNGKYWHGRASYDNGELITLWKCKN